MALVAGRLAREPPPGGRNGLAWTLEAPKRYATEMDEGFSGRNAHVPEIRSASLIKEMGLYLGPVVWRPVNMFGTM